MHELASIHNEQTEKSTRDVINGKYNIDDGANIEQSMKDNIQYPYQYSEDDAEFIEQRILLKETIQYP